MASRPTQHRKKHPGVTVVKPEPGRRIGWRARYRDPDTGKLIKETVPPGPARTREGRDAWAAAKAAALARRRWELSDGAPRATGTTIARAIKDYFEAREDQLSRWTLKDYRATGRKFEAWAEGERIRTLDELTRPRLLAWRDTVINEPGRGHYAINRELGSLRALLGYWHDRDLLPRLKDSDLRRALKKVPRVVERPVFLSPEECQATLSAALVHDAEHTPAIGSMVAVAMLSGLRYAEVLELEWEAVDLRAEAIHLRGADVKTRHARDVDLAVSPGLLDLLQLMRGPRGRNGPVFGLSEKETRTAMDRLRIRYGAPPTATWAVFRRTAETYLSNMPSQGVFKAAKRAGHSVSVSERHYAGLVRVAPEATTLEAAMGVETEVDELRKRLRDR